MESKLSQTLVISVAILGLAYPAKAQTARAYYEELYKAGGLDPMADGHVCFDDSTDLLTFFIFGQSKTLRQFLIDNGGYTKLSASQRALLDKGYLNVRQYDRGVAVGDESFYEKDGDSWVTEKFDLGKKQFGRVRLTISWATLRYKKTVELQQPDGSFRDAYSRYGRCEVVPPDVRQREH